jgi:transposase
MSIEHGHLQGSLFGVVSLTGELFDPLDRYRLFREKILPALYARRNELCALYCENNGRPAIEPVIMAGATLLQFMEKMPDVRAAECVRLHLGWKYALDLELGYEGFHPTSLVTFRGRLLEGGAERVGFDALLDGLQAAGLVRKKRRQRLDSTHVLGLVSKMSRLELTRETIRLALEFIQKSGYHDALANWPLMQERYLDSQIHWGKVSVESLKERFAQAGEDALLLICWLRQQPAFLRDSEKALLLERVFLEQYELADRPVQQKTSHTGAVQNPHDPEAQWASKDNARTKTWVGYKTQIAETVSDEDERVEGAPTEQFITEVITTPAITSDIEGLKRNLVAQSEERDEKPAELYVDAAYVTDDTLAKAKETGYELIGPPRPPGNAPKNEFGSDHFDVDCEHRKAVCPAGHESRQCSLIHDHYNKNVFLRFEWAGLCDECVHRKKCTRSREGRRLLVVGIHHDLLQQRRKQMNEEAFTKKLRRRSAIEGTISEFTRGGGRRTRYRGLAKTTLANYFQGAAVNAGRWIRLAQWQMGQREQVA